MSITWTADPGYGGEYQSEWVEISSDLFANFGDTEGWIAEYDAGLGTFDFWSVTAPTWSPYIAAFYQAILLDDGRVLLAGGDGTDKTYLGTYSAGDFTWVASTDMPIYHAYAKTAVAKLSDGRVFVVDAATGPTDCAFWFGTVSGNSISWVLASVTSGSAPLQNPNSVVALSDGRVLVVFDLSASVVFVTVSGNSVSIAAANISGSSGSSATWWSDPVELWPAAVLFAAGYDGPGDTYLPDVVLAEISGDDVVLSAFSDPLPAVGPDINTGLFRLSDTKVLAAYVDTDSGNTYFAVGEDSDPPAWTVEETDMSVNGGSTAGFTGRMVAYRALPVSGSSSADWINPDRVLSIACAASASFVAPTYAKLTAACSSAAVFAASRKVPVSLYWRATSAASFESLFEKPVAMRISGRSRAAFQSRLFAPSALLAEGAARVSFTGRAVRPGAVAAHAASAATWAGRGIVSFACAAAAAGSAYFASSPVRGAAVFAVGGSSSGFVGDFSVAPPVKLLRTTRMVRVRAGEPISQFVTRRHP